MKLLDILLFVSASSLSIIGFHQAYKVGIAESYWIFMLSLMLLLLYGYRKSKRTKSNQSSVRKTTTKKKTKRKHG
ncbi:MAG: hypothetical protein AAF616_09500 [Bacteroidota bacterium]